MSRTAACGGVVALALGFWSPLAHAGVVDPCDRILAIYRAGGEKAWLRQCAADYRRSGYSSDGRACRAALTRCLRNPISPTF